MKKNVLLALIVGIGFAEHARAQGQGVPPVLTCDGSGAPDWQKELFIIHPCVVDNWRTHGNGPWSFGTLMRNLSGTVNPLLQSEFVLRWLETWTDPTVDVLGVNLFSTQKADLVQHFIDQWTTASGGGSLNLDIAPMRLIAIVNRIDLLKVSAGDVSSAGEARFVFDVIDQDPSLGPNGTNGEFFVIFEYGIPAESCEDLVAWASQWRGLTQHVDFDESFCQDLQAITDTFTTATSGGDVNGTFLNQLRTNEISVPGHSTPFWELREFNILPSSDVPAWGNLRNVTCKQEPRREFMNLNKRGFLSQYMQDNKADILANMHTVPDLIPTGAGLEAFLAGKAINALGHPLPPNTPAGNSVTGTRWWAPRFSTEIPITPGNDLARHRFALQTCSGCHREENGTPYFTMTSSRDYGQPAVLSPFLTGIVGHQDPIRTFDPGLVHDFNDLAHRTSVLDRVLALDCGAAIVGVTPVPLQDITEEMGTRVH